MNTSREDPIIAPNVISRIHQMFEEFLKLELEKAGMAGLVASHGHILASLYTEDHLPMWRIADMIKRRKSTVTVLADKLEQEGYIRRETSAEDSRVRQLSLTPKGIQCRDAFMEITERLQENFWHGFSEEEQKLTMHLLARIEENFQIALRTCPSCQDTIRAGEECNPVPSPARN